MCYNVLYFLQQQDVANYSHLLGVNVSSRDVLNGLVSHSLPNDQDWDRAYSSDNCCSTMLKMLKDPSLIGDKKFMEEIHYVYRSRIRDSSIIFKNKRLILIEPTVISDKSIELIIVPTDLQMHIFNSFHTNPLGGHFSVYQTMHRIRLRYHWPRMFQFIKKQINSCPACLMKNNAARPSSELLYSFPLDAPMNTIHADLWSPGKQIGFDGATALMVVVCHMTTFVAIEPVVEQSSKSFAKAVYKIMMRYGLASLIVTDPDSKFKGEFIGMCDLLKIPHHMSSKGNHNAVIVERFNKFLNSGLRIFSTERGTVRVFLEGAETLVYAWNSAPVVGTDISRSLLVTGREYRFPIDIADSKHVTFNINETKLRSFARDLTTLLTKCREIYKVLIEEHRAMHREYRNSQLSNPKKFKINDIVFSNVQIQSSSKSGKVKKLSYTRRGPYKITKCYPSGSYDLKLVSSTSSAIIKKHGSELILCPQELIPHKPIQSSDTIYSEFNKKVSSNPFSHIFIEGYTPAQPWREAAAAAHASLDNTNAVISFPTVAELDDEIDSWPESINPFTTTTVECTTHQDNSSTLRQSRSDKSSNDHTRNKPSSADNISTQILQGEINPHHPRPFNILIQSIIQSRDKLFFIAYNKPNEKRKEWKLVQLDFHQSLKKHSACLQDGKFIANFFIMHPKDTHIPFQHKRFWIEYHKILSLKQLHTSYHLINPSDVSSLRAEKEDLTPYREWVNFSDSETIIHGPFNFSMLNNRQTRDRIDIREWQILSKSYKMYDNDPPSPITPNPVQHVHFNEPICSVHNNDEVTHRIKAFTTYLTLEIHDNIELMFGSNNNTHL